MGTISTECLRGNPQLTLVKLVHHHQGGEAARETEGHGAPDQENVIEAEEEKETECTKGLRD